MVDSGMHTHMHAHMNIQKKNDTPSFKNIIDWRDSSVVEYLPSMFITLCSIFNTRKKNVTEILIFSIFHILPLSLFFSTLALF